MNQEAGDNGLLDPREQGAWPRMIKGAGSKEIVIWEHENLQKGAGNSQKIGKLEQREGIITMLRSIWSTPSKCTMQSPMLCYSK